MAATIKDIAGKTGLGLATISKYLNGGNVLPENREAIERAVAELNYSPNSFARGLKTRRSKAIGVVLPEIHNAAFTAILTEMEYVLKREDYAIVISDCHNDKAKEIESVAFLLSKNVDGVISVPLSRSGRHLEAALAQGVPVLLLDRLIPKLAGQVDSISIDNVKISKEAVQLLTAKGHRRIGLVTGQRGTFTSDGRRRGYCEALEAAGIPVDNALISHVEYTVEGGIVGYKALAAKNPDMTAVFATNHYTTMGVLMAIREARQRIPSDISVLGFDAMDWLQIVEPKLTIVEQPMREMGRIAAEILLKRLGENGEKGAKQAIVLSAKLNIGKSIKKL
ncbi:MAG: LacI family transcriptional regulator [Clostridiales Family XIII bacterium]|jgi:LacI family transcriptional regulator|nr:LacI family transcriptional regulator [Clostridiales Family XIII bacterium]